MKTTKELYHVQPNTGYVHTPADPEYGVAEEWCAAIRNEAGDVVASVYGATLEEAGKRAEVLAAAPHLADAADLAIDELGYTEEFDARQLRDIIDDAREILRAALRAAGR